MKIRDYIDIKEYNELPVVSPSKYGGLPIRVKVTSTVNSKYPFGVQMYIESIDKP